mgnify:CR=1 FL=1
MISIVIPTYNEEQNIERCYENVAFFFKTELPEHKWDIIFIDNCSNDNTRFLIRQIVKKDERVKAIFNARNFGQARSHYYGLLQADGDCAVLLHADLQNPLSTVYEFVQCWKNGAKVVIGIKDSSKENKIIFFLRSCYYKFMSEVSEVEQIEHFSDFELLDRDFLEILKDLDDPTPYLRGIVSEFGFKMEKVHYIQEKRENGKSKANFLTLYDFAMNGITSYTKGVLRLATVLGGLLSLISFVMGIITLVRKIMFWDDFQPGIAAVGVGAFFLLAIILFFEGLMGEYILSINSRLLHRPLVIEEERIGVFYESENDE